MVPGAPHPGPQLTPCSSSFSSCSVTLGVLRASRRQWMFSSGMTYSRASFRGRPRPVPCFVAVGVASSRMEPRRVMSCLRERSEGQEALRTQEGMRAYEGVLFSKQRVRWSEAWVPGPALDLDKDLSLLPPVYVILSECLHISGPRLLFLEMGMMTASKPRGFWED